MKTFAVLLLCLACGVGPAVCAETCPIGVFRDARGQKVIITNPADAGSTPTYRYTLLDGRRGPVGAADSLVRCSENGVQFRSATGWSEPWARMKITETPTRFKSYGADLYGVLIEPPDAPSSRPLVTFVHGSEKTSDIGISYQYMFAAQGISVFMYDKRGTGLSDGFYTQNFELLAEDAATAAREARRMAAGRFGSWGYFGGSQGGWVAPRAAQIGGADFVAVGFGLVMSPLEEDREQVFFELRRKGYDEQVIARAKEVTDATGALVASHFANGYEGLEAVRRRYAKAPWFAGIEGEFTGPLLRADPDDLKRVGAPIYDGLNISWNYDAPAVIRALAMRQLWVLAGSDRDAPGDVTRARLTRMIEAGRPIDLYVFPHTDHGITEYVEAPDGSRTTTRVADGYYRLLGDWIKGQASSTYGAAEHVGRLRK